MHRFSFKKLLKISESATMNHITSPVILSKQEKKALENKSYRDRLKLDPEKAELWWSVPLWPALFRLPSLPSWIRTTPCPFLTSSRVYSDIHTKILGLDCVYLAFLIIICESVFFIITDQHIDSTCTTHSIMQLD